MGISTDAMLYFGFVVGNEDEPPDWLPDGDESEGEGRMEFDDFVALKAGVPADAEYGVRRDAVKLCPAEMQLFCSYDYPMYILGVRGAGHVVHRGYFKAIDAAALAVDPEKIAAFKTWCEANSIPYEEPQWLLCSMYG